MLWVFVVRTLAWCSHILGPIGNVKYPHGRTDQQQRFKSKRKISNAAKIALHFTERPLTTVVTLCMLSLQATRSFHSLGMILDQRFLESTNPERKNRIRTFLKTPVVFRALVSLALSAPLLRFSLEFRMPVHLVFRVSIKWEAAFLVHHFFVRQRLKEFQPLVDFSSMSFNYSVCARSWPTSCPGCFSLALEVGRISSRARSLSRPTSKRLLHSYMSRCFQAPP